MSASEVSTTGGGEMAASPPAKVRPGALGWYTVWMTTLVAVMSQIDRGVLALFVQPLKRDFGLSDTNVSFLLGFAFTFFYVVGGPPLSRLADRGIRKNVISGCLATWSLATGLCALAQGFWGFFAARAVIGTSESGCGPASLSMIADAVPREKLPRAYALYNSGFVGGIALSLIVGGVLMGMLANIPTIAVPGIGSIHNWQWVFVILGVPGLIIAFLVRFTVPEPPRKDGHRPEGFPIKEVFRFVYSQRALHIPFITGVLFMGLQTYGLAAWLPAFYERTYGWGPARIGPLLGTTMLVSSVIGLFFGAWLAEWLGKRHDDGNLRALFLAQLLSFPIYSAAYLMPSPWMALGLVGVASVFNVMGAPGFNSALQLATPNEMRSQINVMYFILNNAIAGSLGPTLVALCTDYIAHSEADLRYVILGFRMVAGPLTAFFLWKALKPYAQVFRQRIAENA